MNVLKRGLGLAFVVLVFLAVVVFAELGLEGDLTSSPITGMASNYEVSSVLLKVSLNQGASSDKAIAISSDKGGEFVLEVVGVQGMSLSEDRFVLQLDEKKEITVKFDSTALDPGVYVGQIRISGGEEESVIPVIFEIESQDVFFDVNLDIPPQYSSVAPGEKMLAQVKIFDLISGGTTEGLGATNVETEYYLFSLDGSILSSETENLVVDQQARVTKTLTLPSDVNEGNYVFVSLVKYKSSVGVSSQLFTISGGGFAFSGDFFEGGNSLIIIIVLAVLIFLLLIFGMFVYMVRSRDKLLLQLRGYNSWEMKKEKAVLNKEEKVEKEKGPILYKAFKKKVKKKILGLKIKQKSRVKEFKKLKKAKNTKGMLSKLNEWKNQGYHTYGLEYKIKGLSKKDMKGQLGKWKKEYGKKKPKSIKRKK